MRCVRGRCCASKHRRREFHSHPPSDIDARLLIMEDVVEDIVDECDVVADANDTEAVDTTSIETEHAASSNDVVDDSSDQRVASRQFSNSGYKTRPSSAAAPRRSGKGLDTHPTEWTGENSLTIVCLNSDLTLQCRM